MVSNFGEHGTIKKGYLCEKSGHTALHTIIMLKGEKEELSFWI